MKNMYFLQIFLLFRANLGYAKIEKSKKKCKTRKNDKLGFKNGKQLIGYIFRLFNLSEQICNGYRLSRNKCGLVKVAI